MASSRPGKVETMDVECVPTEGESGRFVLRVRDLDQQRLGDLAWQIQNKLTGKGEQFETTYLRMAGQLKSLVAVNAPTCAFEIPLTLDELGDLAPKVRDRLTRHTARQYRGFYAKLSRELTRARDRHFLKS